jgi:hypothetical protein
MIDLGNYGRSNIAPKVIFEKLQLIKPKRYISVGRSICVLGGSH